MRDTSTTHFNIHAKKFKTIFIPQHGKYCVGWWSEYDFVGITKKLRHQGPVGMKEVE